MNTNHQFSLSDYIGKKDLTENLNLSNNISFHWANWDETCLLQRRHYKNFNHNYHLNKLNNALMELKTRPVWICNKVKVLKIDMYSLYESYLDSRLRMTWFERKDEILFSMDSEQGPYFTLTSMKWLDKEVYSMFVLRKILLDFFTLRSFRLNTNIPLVLKFDNDVNFYHDKVEIHQISENGLILKFVDKNFINKIKNSTKLELRIPIGQYAKVAKKPFEETWKVLNSSGLITNEDFKNFTLDSKILNFYGNLTNTRRSGEEEFYLFARYEDLTPMKHDEDLKNIFKTLVDKTKNRFNLELEKIKDNKLEEKKSA